MLDIEPLIPSSACSAYFRLKDRSRRGGALLPRSSFRSAIIPLSSRSAGSSAQWQANPMSQKFPIISVTGSSGAGTSTVKHTFDQIFRREGDHRRLHRGRCVHAYDRAAMKKVMAEEGIKGNAHFSHFGPEANLLDKLEETFRTYGATGKGKTRHYIHDAGEEEKYGAPAGTFTEWEDLPEGSDTPLLRRAARRCCHGQGQCRPLRGPEDRRRARDQSRMDAEASS